MMDALGQYALRLMVGSVICGTVLRLVCEKTHRSLVRILCAVMMLQLLLAPKDSRKWGLDTDCLKDAVQEGERLAASGEDLARSMQIRRMKQALEAYILDKARALQTDLTVEIEIDENRTPVSAVFRGTADDRTKQILADLAEAELGIAKENQRWTG